MFASLILMLSPPPDPPTGVVTVRIDGIPEGAAVVLYVNGVPR